MYMPRSESLSKLHSHVRNTLDCYTRLSHKNYTTNKERSLDTEINEQILWFSINSKGNNSSQGWTDWHDIFSESCSKWYVSLFWRMSNGNWKLIIYDILYYVHYAPFLLFHFFLGGGGGYHCHHLMLTLSWSLKALLTYHCLKIINAHFSYRTVYYNVAMPKFTCTIQNNFNMYIKKIKNIYIHTHIYIHIYVYLN